MRKILKWVQLISSILLAIGAIGLLMVTLFYTNHTKRMADNMDKQFNLSYEQYQQNNRPYLFLEDYKWELDEEDEKDDILFTAHMKNSGNIPANFELTKLIYIIDEKEHIIDPNEYEFRLNSFIFPNQDTKITALNPSEEVMKLILSRKNLKVVLKFNYWGLGDKEKKNTFFHEKHMLLIEDPNDSSSFILIHIYTDAN